MDDPDVIEKFIAKRKDQSDKPILVKVTVNDSDDMTWSWNVYNKDTFFPALNNFITTTK
jgi:hypothetical protein